MEEPSSGVNPSLANGYKNLAFDEAITMSPKLTKAKLAPPPTASPFTAKIKGLGKSQNAIVWFFSTKSGPDIIIMQTTGERLFSPS